MTTSLVDAESVLAIDLGSRTTRALLFDVVDGQYSFIASGSANTTLEAPYRDIGEGTSQAIMQLQSITGRTLISKEGQVILPSQASGAGVDRHGADLFGRPRPARGDRRAVERCLTGQRTAPGGFHLRRRWLKRSA